MITIIQIIFEFINSYAGGLLSSSVILYGYHIRPIIAVNHNISSSVGKELTEVKRIVNSPSAEFNTFASYRSNLQKVSNNINLHYSGYTQLLYTFLITEEKLKSKFEKWVVDSVSIEAAALDIKNKYDKRFGDMDSQLQHNRQHTLSNTEGTDINKLITDLENTQAAEFTRLKIKLKKLHKKNI